MHTMSNIDRLSEMFFDMVFYLCCSMKWISHLITPFAIYTSFPSCHQLDRMHIGTIAKHMNSFGVCFEKTKRRIARIKPFGSYYSYIAHITICQQNE